ncbi:MAG TPA: MFS transporter [Methanomassiliicoccales archaeon]|nr:MFS transporter [Methanomassiliicoccales archaeon]
MAKEIDKEEKWYYSFLPYNASAGSTNALIPLFITEGLKGSVAQVGIVNAAISLASVPGAILWGNLSDTTRKRVPFVLLGFLGVAFSLLLMGFASNMTEYYVANLLFGFMGASIAPVGTVMVLECFPRQQWATRLGDFSRVGGLGWVLGLILGTTWLTIFPDQGEGMQMRALFLLAGGLGFLSMFLGWHYMREPSRSVLREELPQFDLYRVPNYLMEKLRYMPQRLLYIVELSSKNMSSENYSRNLRMYCAVVFMAFTGFLGFYVALPIYLNQYVGLSSAQVFAVYLASSFISMIFYAYSGKLVDRFGGRRVQGLAFGLRMVIFPLFFLVTMVTLDVNTLFLLMCLLNGLSGMCWALLIVAGDSLVAGMSRRQFRSQSMGMYNSVRGIATIVGSLLGGVVAQYFGYLSLFLLSSAFVLVSIVLLMIIKVDKDPEGESEAVAL